MTEERTRWQKLFSLSGVIPLGAFLLLHLWTGAALLSSHAVYDRQVSFLHGGPILGFLEIVLVLVPLVFHAGYGLWRSVQPKRPGHGYDSDLMLVLERISGVVVLVFVVAHLWETRMQTWTGGLLVGSYSTKLVEHLSSTSAGIPWIALGYLAGIAATVFHLVNGLTSFATTWGFAEAPASHRRARLLFRGAGILVFGIGAATVVELATGVRLLSPTHGDSGAPGLCGSAAAPVQPAAPVLAPSGLPSASP